MTTARELSVAVREAWQDVPAPPPEQVEFFEWGWGPEAARTFVGVAPVDVDRRSEGFRAATPLLDLRRRQLRPTWGPSSWHCWRVSIFNSAPACPTTSSRAHTRSRP